MTVPQRVQANRNSSRLTLRALAIERNIICLNRWTCWFALRFWVDQSVLQVGYPSRSC